jgi:hypothetical protein
VSGRAETGRNTTDNLTVGRGTGLFTDGIGQLHMMIQLALKKKRAVQIGSGSGVREPLGFPVLPKISLLIDLESNPHP